MFLDTNLVSWAAKRHLVVSRCSAEAEYAELHNPLERVALVYCGNVSAVYLCTNPVQYQRTKHVEIDLHFV